MASFASSTHAERALRDALVRAAWDRAVVLERLGSDEARALLADGLAAHVEQARSSLKPLEPWPAQPEKVTKTLHDDANQVRIRRTLDYVLTGERLLEIGVGFGQVSGTLMRDRALSGYTGIDIGQHRLDAVHQMADKNGFDQSKIETALVDLMEISPEWVRERDPDFILAEEVLEHVPDAEGALTALARCMRPDCCVLLTLPLLGRIEACWGHLSLFPVSRVQRMLWSAGLVAHHVEVIHDAWLFVLASPSEEVPERLLQLPPLPEPEATAPVVPEFVDVDLKNAKAVGGGRAATVTTDEDVATAKVTARRGRERQLSGMEFDIAGDIALRLELRTDAPKNVHRFHIDLHDGDRRIARWTWDPAVAKIPVNKTRTFVLRPGQAYGAFRPEGEVAEGTATSARVLAEISRGASAEFSVLRAAAVRERRQD
jgi:2-polyprenyl-3-methyl-5-hydroxy-6-metoxy-1,4-benzoquinol methylase